MQLGMAMQCVRALRCSVSNPHRSVVNRWNQLVHALSVEGGHSAPVD